VDGSTGLDVDVGKPVDVDEGSEESRLAPATDESPPGVVGAESGVLVVTMFNLDRSR
jgi:hypothetical protein